MAKSRRKLKRRRPQTKRRTSETLQSRPSRAKMTALMEQDGEMHQFKIRPFRPQHLWKLDGPALKVLLAIARHIDIPDSMTPLTLPFPYDAIPWRLVDDRILAQLNEDAVKVLFVIACAMERSPTEEREVCTADGRFVKTLHPLGWTKTLTDAVIAKQLRVSSDIVAGGLSELVERGVILVDLADPPPGYRCRIL